MSLPSFKLSKGAGGAWVAEGALPSGRPFRIDCGKGSRDRAEGVAELRLKAKLASSSGSRARWVKFRAERAAAGARVERGDTGSSNSAPPPVSTPASAAAPPVDNEALRAKLLGLGDAQAIPPSEPDRVIPPGAPRDEHPADAGDDQADELDTEGAELIASLMAKGATIAIVGLANAPLKKRKPPMRGEPHEKGLEWFHDGLEANLFKLIGKTATLGPTGKMLCGAAIIVGSVWMTAEPIDAAAAAPAPPQPAPTAPSSTNGAPPAPPAATRALTVAGGSPLGVFGVERKDKN